MLDSNKLNDKLVSELREIAQTLGPAAEPGHGSQRTRSGTKLPQQARDTHGAVSGGWPV